MDGRQQPILSDKYDGRDSDFARSKPWFIYATQSWPHDNVIFLLHTFYASRSTAGTMNTTSIIEGLSYWRFSLAAASLAFATYIISCLYAALTSPLKSIPGPWISLFTDRQLKSAGTAGKRIFYIDELHKKYGPVVRISPDEVTVFDIEAFRQIHAVSGGYTKSEFYTKLTNFPVHSVFTLRDAKAHGVRRRLFAKGFSKSHVKQHFEDVVRERVSLAVKKIVEDGANHGGKVDVFKWWSLMSADIVGCLGFGESFNLLELGAVGVPPRAPTSLLLNNCSVRSISRFWNSLSSATVSALSILGCELCLRAFL